MIKLVINGKERELDGPTRLISFLETLNVNMKFIAVAHNGNVLQKDEMGGVTLSEGDQVEIVRAVGGG